MEKKCLVIMPIGDQDGYTQGHFNRVYEYVIAPACKMSDFTPIKIDDAEISGSPMDLLKSIIDCEMAVCDLSTGSTNASYGFAIRQALQLPVIPVKDSRTVSELNLAGYDGLEYDDSLRIDTVQTAIAKLADGLKSVYANRPDPHTLIRPFVGGKIELPAPELDLSVLEELPHKESGPPIISPLPDYVGEPVTQKDIDKLKVGDFIFHLTRGKGEITSLKKAGQDKIAGLNFESGSAILVLATSGYFRKIKS